MQPKKTHVPSSMEMRPSSLSFSSCVPAAPPRRPEKQENDNVRRLRRKNHVAMSCRLKSLETIGSRIFAQTSFTRSSNVASGRRVRAA